MGMGKLGAAELNAITEARRLRPLMGQRTLAKDIYASTHFGGIGYQLRFRGKPTIYAAIRRLDERRKSQAANEMPFAGV